MRQLYSVILISFALLALFLLGSFSPAQTNEAQAILPSNLHQWGAVSMFHGLPSDNVRAIAQDSDGVMWFGTDAGLVKYDGRRVQRVAIEGIKSDRVRALSFDQSGALWIGTDSGAARMSKNRCEPIHQTAGKNITAIITQGGNRAIMTAEQGSVFDITVNTDGSFAVRAIEPKDHRLLSIESHNARPLPLTSVALDNNRLIVGTRGRGLLSIADGQVEEIYSRPRPYFIEAIERDRGGRLSIGAQTMSADGGLYDFSDLTRPVRIGSGLGTVTSIKFDQRGILWVGTDQRGVFQFRNSRDLFHFTFDNTAGGLRSNRIHTILIDREGVIWFGTDRGACRYDPASFRVENISTVRESNFARTLFQSRDHRLWCGTNRGLFVRNDAGWVSVDTLKGRTIHAISEDKRGHLIVGAASGLFVSEAPINESASSPNNLRFLRISPGDRTSPESDSVRAILDFRGVIYIANFGRGLEIFDGQARAPLWPAVATAMSERQAVSLYAQGNERLWIGTANAGVFTFDGREVRKVAATDSLRDAAVWAICETRDGAMLIASSRGLYALKSENLQPVIEGVDARALIVINNTNPEAIWCATANEGLYAVTTDRQAGPLVSRLGTEQGLPSQNAFAILLTKDESDEAALWAGTSRGVARYKPDSVTPRLMHSRVMGRRVYTTEEIASAINLEYPQNSLSVEVTAISARTFPEQFQYFFALIDEGGKVIREKLSRESHMLIENLPPGRYRLLARAFTGNLVASDSLSLEFTIERAPFPWTTLALSVLLAFALAALWWGYRQNSRLSRTNQALAGANLLLAETRMQIASQTEAERRRIARDLHDQTLADLRKLMLFTDELPKPDTEDEQTRVKPSQIRKEIESISTEIRRICEDLSPSALDNVGLAAALEWAVTDAVAQLPSEKRFRYEFDCQENIEEKLKFTHSEQIQIYRIVQEALSNVCRHSDARHVRLALRAESEGGFLLELEDDGRGFDPKAKSAGNGRGLANIRSRASLIEAEVEWIERPQGGTRFTLHKSAGVKE